jgi:hypothetical protein
VWQAVAEGFWRSADRPQVVCVAIDDQKFNGSLILVLADLLSTSNPAAYQAAIANLVMTTNPEIVRLINTPTEKIELSALSSDQYKATAGAVIAALESAQENPLCRVHTRIAVYRPFMASTPISS